MTITEELLDQVAEKLTKNKYHIMQPTEVIEYPDEDDEE